MSSQQQGDQPKANEVPENKLPDLKSLTTENTNTNTNTNTNVNTNTEKKNEAELPKTGVDDTMLWVLIGVSVVAAGYTYKKVRDYNV